MAQPSQSLTIVADRDSDDDADDRADSDSNAVTAQPISHTVKRIPRGMWVYWKPTVDGNIEYDRLGDRIIDLVAADLAARDAHGSGAVELLLEHDLLSSEELDEAKNRDPPK